MGLLNFRWLVNAGLLILPVGTTIGVLIGVDSQRAANGQKPIFNTPTGGTGTGSGGTGNKGDDRVTSQLFCQKQVGYTAPSSGIQYTCKWLLFHGFVWLLGIIGDRGMGSRRTSGKGRRGVEGHLGRRKTRWNDGSK